MFFPCVYRSVTYMYIALKYGSVCVFKLKVYAEQCVCMCECACKFQYVYNCVSLCLCKYKFCACIKIVCSCLCIRMQKVCTHTYTYDIVWAQSCFLYYVCVLHTNGYW